MYVDKLSLRNWRTYSELTFEPASGLNIIVGDNAAGKTNLLESLYYLAAGASQRTSRDSELIRWGSDSFQIQAEIRGTRARHSLEFSYHQNEGKKYLLDGVQMDSLREVLGVVNAVIFSPDDLSLVKGAPENRRDFLDAEISQIDPRYQADAVRYRRIVRQRNDELKRIASAKSSKATADLLLDPWNEQLVKTGRELISTRLLMLRLWGGSSCKSYKKLSRGSETLTIAYVMSTQPKKVVVVAGSRVEEADGDISGKAPGRSSLRRRSEQLLSASLKKLRDDEIRRGYTLAGPHRDDIGFYVNQRAARHFASQGQQRSVALALKIGEVQWMKTQTSSQPLLLLDDVMSELDSSRSERLAQLVGEDGQTFITCTDLGDLNIDRLEGATLWRVDAGEVMRVG